jgi:surface protein
LSNWNTKNVIYMNSMFCRVDTFNSDLSKWDINNVKDMSYMFYGCTRFNKNYISNWDTQNVEKNNMFLE